jgi:hypothetical protein
MQAYKILFTYNSKLHYLQGYKLHNLFIYNMLHQEDGSNLAIYTRTETDTLLFPFLNELIIFI